MWDDGKKSDHECFEWILLCTNWEVFPLQKTISLTSSKGMVALMIDVEVHDQHLCPLFRPMPFMHDIKSNMCHEIEGMT